MEVEVIYPYEPQHTDELKLEVGDIIQHVEYAERGWYTGTLNNIRGLFPDNFVHQLRNQQVYNHDSGSLKSTGNIKSDSSRYCQAIFDYSPQHEDELPICEGDIISVVDEVEDGWWKGVLKGKVGVFPSNFVEEIPKQNAIGATQSISEITSTLEQESQSLPNGNDVPQNDPLSSSPEAKRSVNTHEAKMKTSAIDEECPPKLPPKPVRELARVLYSYTPEYDDELELHKEDRITILSKAAEDKGWWKGELHGKVGVFPDNFVKIVVQDEESANSQLADITLKQTASISLEPRQLANLTNCKATPPEMPFQPQTRSSSRMRNEECKEKNGEDVTKESDLCVKPLMPRSVKRGDSDQMHMTLLSKIQSLECKLGELRTEYTNRVAQITHDLDEGVKLTSCLQREVDSLKKLLTDGYV